MPPQIDVIAGGGDYAVVDVRLAAGTEVPPHRLAREDRTVLVLDGRLEVVYGRERLALGPGDPVVLPRTSPCRLRALSDVRVLVVAVPAGLEALADVFTTVGALDDDASALLTAAGVSLLPTGWRAAS